MEQRIESTVDDKTIDVIDMIASDKKDYSDDEIRQVQQQMHALGAMMKTPKASGGNKKKIKNTARIAKRKMQSASRRVNRSK